MTRPPSARRLLRRFAPAAALLALLALPSAASATYFTSETIDGPSANLRSAGDVDLARDGTGAVAYVKSDGGVDHIFVSRVVAGAWTPGERIDGALAGTGSQPAVAAGTGGRLTVLFVSDGTVYAVTRDAGAGWLAPQPLGAPASSPAVDMSVHGTAYATFTVNGDVAAARLDRKSTTWQVFPGALDADPADDAGDGPALRSRVATSAEGSAVAVWGEVVGGTSHVMARRILPTGPSTIVNDLTVGALNGLAGGNASMPNVDIEDDASYGWAVFLQATADGQTRTVARRLRGSRFEDPVVVDGLPTPAADSAVGPQVELTGDNDGLVTSGLVGNAAAMGAVVHFDAFAPALRMDAGSALPPVPAVSENGVMYGVWPVSDGSMHARAWALSRGVTTVPAPDVDTAIANPALGPVDASLGYDASADRLGDMAAVFVQSGADGQRLVVAGFDKPPGKFGGYTSTNWRPVVQPPLTWAEPTDLWGLSYQVTLDGAIVAANLTKPTWTPPQPLAQGAHAWSVTVVDHRGQTYVMPNRALGVDTIKPTLTASVPTSVRAGSLLTVRASAKDPAAPGLAVTTASGINAVTVHWGDGSKDSVLRGGAASHRFAKPAKVTVAVTAKDKAANATVVSQKVTVAKPKPKRGSATAKR